MRWPWVSRPDAAPPGPSKYYQLTVPGDLAPAANSNPVPITLLIGRLTGPALYRADQIVYSTGSESMGTYEYQRWSEPPTRDDRRSHASAVPRLWPLSRRLYACEAIFAEIFFCTDVSMTSRKSTGAPIVGRVTMELELRNIKTGISVWTHFYTHDEPVSGKEVGAIVAALDKNVQQAVAEFRASLDQYFAEHPPAQPAP